MHEVYAGFLSHTDAQIGRVVAALEKLGALDNTLILVMSDNGASAEAGVTGTSNEHRFSHGIPDDLADNLTRLEDWGGQAGYPHYSWGWAWAGNTPFRLWKRYTWLGGTRVPMIVHWPAGVAAAGAVRGQFGHVIDVAPAILDVCGVPQPESLDGASLRMTFDDAQAPSPRQTQYFEMVGSRSIIADGWKATTDHVSAGISDEEKLILGSRDFEHDRWSLFRFDEDFSEATDVAEDHPDIVRRLEQQWYAEAERNNVLPLADSFMKRLAYMDPPDYPAGSSVTIYPEGGPLTDEALPMLIGGGRLVADVEVPDTDANGVLFALGDWNGGMAIYVVEGVLTAAIATPETPVRISAPTPIPPGQHWIGCVLTLGTNGTTVDLVIDDIVVASGPGPRKIPVAW